MSPNETHHERTVRISGGILQDLVHRFAETSAEVTLDVASGTYLVSGVHPDFPDGDLEWLQRRWGVPVMLSHVFMRRTGHGWLIDLCAKYGIEEGR